SVHLARLSAHRAAYVSKSAAGSGRIVDGSVRRAFTTVTILVGLAAAAAPEAHAGPRAERKITMPDATAAERALFADARDDRLDTHDPVTAALVSSSIGNEEKEKAIAR